MPLVQEFFDGGLRTNVDPTLLAPGELQQADECVYRLHDPAIHRAPGRAVLNSTTIKDATGSTCPVKGLADLLFDPTADAQVLALGGSDNGNGTLWAGAFSALSGLTFALVTGPGQVTDCVLNGTAVVTSATGFSNMVLGARVYGGGFPAHTVVITLTSSTSITLSNATAVSGSSKTLSFDIGIAVAPSDQGDEALSAISWGATAQKDASGTPTAGGFYFTVIGHTVPLRTYYKGRSITGTALADLLVSRPVGLNPVLTPPTVATTTGVWNSLLGNGWFWFLVTEVYNAGEIDEVEGTYAALDAKGKVIGPIPVQITDHTTQGVRVTFPADSGGNVIRANDGSGTGRLSTHWYIYMTPAPDGTNQPSLSIFRRVASVSMFAADGTLVQFKDLTESALAPRVGYPSAKAAVGARNEFTNPSNLLNAPNGTYATGVSGGASGANNVPLERLNTWLFSGTDGTYTGATVIGIRITVRGLSGLGALSGSGANASFNVSAHNASSGTDMMMGVFVYSFPTDISFGDIQDTLGVTWAATDFKSDGSGGFFGYIEKRGTGGKEQIAIDAIRATIYFTGTSINMNGAPFRVITYRDQIGYTQDFPARFPPPVSSTAAIFQGSIVTNNIANNAALVWSLPGEPESWPHPYVMKFAESYPVTCIRTLGQILVVGTLGTVKRVNYLPSEIDTDFREGLAHEPLADDHGIVGPLAAALFTLPGAGPMLAYVALNGIHVTDGVSSRFLNNTIKLANIIEPTKIQNCVLRNYPNENWLVLYYTPTNGTKNTRALIYVYDQPRQDGMLRVIGPVSVGARSAAEFTRSGQSYIFTGHHSGGLIYVEDQGVTIPNGYTTDGTEVVKNSPNILTRRFYGAGIDRNTRIERIYVQHSAAGTHSAGISSVLTVNSNQITAVTPGAYASLAVGMKVINDNIPGDAIITIIAGDTITMSQPATASATSNVVFDSGTLSVLIRGQNIGEGIVDTDRTYVTTFYGGPLVAHNDNQRQSLEMRIQKVALPDSTVVDLGVDMRLHYFAYDAGDAGKEQNRASA
jgi:hypothetical protein